MQWSARWWITRYALRPDDLITSNGGPSSSISMHPLLDSTEDEGLGDLSDLLS